VGCRTLAPDTPTNEGLLWLMRHVADLLTFDRDVTGSAGTTKPIFRGEASDAAPVLVLLLTSPLRVV